MKDIRIKKENVKLFELVQQAVSILVKEDKDLLERHLHERTIAFRLGHYLQCLILNGDYGIDRDRVVVDAEYDRNGGDKKGVYGSCKYNINGCTEYNDCYIKTDTTKYCRLKVKKNTYIYEATLHEFVKKTYRTKYMIPDLLIHERMSTGNIYNKYNNYVAIEIKKREEHDRNRIENKVLDFAKLTYLTCKAGEYKYKLGLYLEFNGCECSYEAFEDGKKVDNGILENLT